MFRYTYSQGGRITGKRSLKLEALDLGRKFLLHLKNIPMSIGARFARTLQVAQPKKISLQFIST
ncbi:MAG: hypothetical protein N2235_07025 [Fischerella sp.]|nr:hypothetical protein [Fischerella sp.]